MIQVIAVLEATDIIYVLRNNTIVADLDSQNYPEALRTKNQHPN